MKLVKEHINFERGLDPKEAMSIGDVTKRNLDKIYRSMCQIANEFEVNPSQVLRDDEAALSAFNYKGFVYVFGLNPNSDTISEWDFSISYEKLADDQTRNKRLEYEQQEFDSFDEAKDALREWLYYREQANEI